MALSFKSLACWLGCSLLLVSLVACTAEPPGGTGNPPPVPSTDPRFGDYPQCSPPALGALTGCGQPGHVCANDVAQQGEPEGSYVDVAACTLDLSFTRGTIVTQRNRIDLIVHLGPQISGLARVEASEDGEHYAVVGFINNTPANTDPRCLGRCASGRCQVGQLCGDGQPCWQEPALAGAGTSEGYCLLSACRPGAMVLFDLSADDQAGGCNTVYDVHHVRISQYVAAGGSVTVDAVEATVGSFQLERQQ